MENTSIQIAQDWRTIQGYSPRFEVNSTGQVRVLNYRNSGMPKMLDFINIKGYLKVGIVDDCGITRQRFVHRLVALAFIPNPDNLPQINHKDENKTNNRVDNLEWCTARYNVNYGTNRERALKTLKKTTATQEYKQNASARSRLVWSRQDYVERMSKIMREMHAKRTPEEEEAWRQKLRGRKLSVTDCLKISENGKKRWEREGRNGSMMAALRKASMLNRKPVTCLDTGISYASINDAEAASGVSAKRISWCCSRNAKHPLELSKSGGFIWIYADRQGENQ